MLFRTFKYSLWYFPVCLAVLCFTSYIWYPGYLIVPPNLMGFFEYVELTVPLLLVAFCSFTLNNRYEIELSLVCGTSTAKLFFSKVIPIFFYTLTPAFIVLALFKFIPYDGTARARIPIFVPENFRVYAAISIFVTVFFFFALMCFLRVISRNCYVTLFPAMFLVVYFSDMSNQIKKGVLDVKLSLVNPFISMYMLGDTVPNAYADQVDGMEIMRNAWTYNRIGFFVVGVILLAMTYILLKSEKLHQGLKE